MTSIQGRVALPEILDCQEASVIIRVFDVTFIDAPGRLLAETTFSITCLETDSIPFELPLDKTVMPEKGRVTISAEIRINDAARLGPGDWVTTQSTALQKEEIEGRALVVVPVRRIPKLGEE